MGCLSARLYIMLLLACGIYILSYFQRVCITVLSLDISRELQVSPADVAYLSSATIVAYGLMQLPTGLLADAFGARKTIVLLSVLAGAGTLCFAMGGTLESMTASRFVVGIGLAVTVPALALLAAWFPAHTYARAASILLGCGGLGAVLATPPLVFLSEVFGWRSSMIIFSAITLGLAVLIWICVPEISREHVAQNSASTWRSILLGIRDVIRTKAFWVIAIWQMCISGASFALSSLWWGPYLMQGCGFTQREAGLALSVAFTVMVVFQVFMGFLSDVVVKGRKNLIFGTTAVALASSVFMIFFTGNRPFSVVLLQITLFIMSLSGASSLIFTMLRETFPLRLVGTAIGCMNMFYPLWAALIQKMYGLMYVYQINQGAPPEAAFGFATWIIVLNCFAAFSMCFLMKETYKK